MTNKWEKPVSVQTVYKKSISFHVNRFEEWQCCQCTKRGNLNFDIHLIVNCDSIFVEIPQSEKFRTHKSVSFPFLGSSVLEDRVQYVNAPGSSTDPTRPIVLHIFVKDDKIDFIRFAMSFPDRIIEFYGFQIESITSNPNDFDEVIWTHESDGYKLSFLLSIINIASCDGEISEEEMQTIFAYIQRERLSRADFERVITNPASVPYVVPQSASIRAQHLRDLVSLSMVDGTFNTKEYDFCMRTAIGFGFDPSVIDFIRQELNNKIGANI